MDRYLDYFTGCKIFYFLREEYSIFDLFKFFPYKKYYYISITFVPTLTFVPMAYTKHAMVYFDLGTSEKFLNNRYDIFKLESIYKSEFSLKDISFSQDVRGLSGEFIFNKSVDTGTPFSENSSIGVPLNLFFYRKKVVKYWVQMNVDITHCNVQEIKIKQSKENQMEMQTIIDTEVNEFTGKNW